METYTRYFRITSGPVLEKAREIEANNQEARKAVLAFCHEIGAENAMNYRDGSLAGFKFKTTPDQQVWKQPDSYGAYWPRKNSAAGRDMLARIKALPPFLPLFGALELVGLYGGFPILIGGGVGYTCTICGSADLGVYFVGVPWRDKSPEDLAEYRMAKENKSPCSNSELEHLQWQPTADMVEIKRWEMEKEIEELNARLRDMKAQEGRAAA